MPLPLLVVLAGRPGTGKTTLGRRVAVELGAAVIRVDAIETAVVRCGLAEPPVGPVGYVVAHEVAAATLGAGTPVLVDAVNPVADARTGWHALASVARVVVFETALPDEVEHRRRVTSRRPDLVGQTVPTWDDVLAWTYEPWDESRDGPRQLVDTTDSEQALQTVLAVLREQDRTAAEVR